MRRLMRSCRFEWQPDRTQPVPIVTYALDFWVVFFSPKTAPPA
jgi:hypothetical protein